LTIGFAVTQVNPGQREQAAESDVMSLVEFEQTADVGHIILNRPEAGNSVNPALIDDLGKAVDAACAASVRAILIRARGANFSLGGDVRHLVAVGNGAAAELHQMATRFHIAQLRLCQLPVPILAAVRGNTIGGGFGLALSADFLICADTARFSTGYSRLGLSADAGVSYFLTRAVGARRAAALLIDAGFLSADEAVAIGIADRQVPDADLGDAAEQWAAELAAGPTSAFAAIKRLTDTARTNSLAQQLDRETEEITALAEREDVIAAIGAIAARTKPVFKG
jgi:2-(1,2-epoxy-1,2-dihydrophenyl)acetyl-CoA isomerase